MANTDLVSWMRDDVLPFWAVNGRDPASGWFHERLQADGRPDAGAIQRIRVQFRQIYVYAHADMLGWHPGGASIALAAFHETMRRGWAPDGKPGFVHLLTPDRAIHNPLRDSYDHAFAVLALTWLFKATGDAAVGKALEDTLAFVDAHLTAADGSLLEGWPASLPRRQNPNMHWFEAMLALKEVISHPSADARLARAYSLFERIHDPETDTIGEYFDDAWNPAPAPAGDSVEPGHLAEWTWLLRQHERIGNRPSGATATRLISSALRTADPVSGLMVDESDRHGQIRRATRRIWLQTELVKAWVAEAEIGVPGAADAARRALDTMDRHYLRQPMPQGWVDQLDATLRPIAGPVQASILYHIFVAVIEADRVLGK